MSNKLTNEKLKELIKEIIQERRYSPPVDVKNFDAQDFIDKIFYGRNRDKATVKGLTDKDFKDIADNDGNADNLTVNDYTQANPTDKAIVQIKKYGYKGHSDAAKKAAGGPPPPPGPSLNQADVDKLSLTKTKKLLAKLVGQLDPNASSQDKTLVDNITMVFNALPLKYKSGKVTPSTADKEYYKKAYDLLSSNPLEMPKRDVFTLKDLTDRYAGIKAGDQDLEAVAGDLDFPTADLDTSSVKDETDLVKASARTLAGKISLPQHIVDTFGLFGNDMVGVFKEMQDVAKIIESGRGFPTGRADALEFIAKANLVIKLGNMGKKFDASSAGFEFEKFCAALFGGMNMGGINGAVDVYTKMKDGAFMYTSQKYLKGDGDVTQGGAGEFGLDRMFDALEKQSQEKAVYYFAARKQTDKTKYTALNIYFLAVKPSTGSGVGGNYDTFQWNGTQWENIKSSAKKGGDLTVSPANLDNPIAQIPLLPSPDGSSVAIANYAREQMGKAGGEIESAMKKLNTVFKKLRAMEQLTTSYTATVKDPAKAQNYVNDIADNYVSISTQDGFGGLFTSSEKTTAKVGGAQVFKENKTKSLKDLDKLIERVILESMNKK